MNTPPLLPEETLRRVLRVANMEGMSVLAVAGFLTLVSAAAGDYQATAVGLLVAAAGAIELHGAGLLRAGEARGTQLLIFSQPYLMAILLLYCGWQLTHVDQELIAQLKVATHRVYGDQTAEKIAAAGLTEPQYYRLMYDMTFWAMAIATVAYQGGMTVYYVRRREPLVAAVEASDSLSD